MRKKKTMKVIPYNRWFASSLTLLSTEKGTRLCKNEYFLEFRTLILLILLILVLIRGYKMPANPGDINNIHLLAIGLLGNFSDPYSKFLRQLFFNY